MKRKVIDKEQRIRVIQSCITHKARKVHTYKDAVETSAFYFRYTILKFLRQVLFSRVSYSTLEVKSGLQIVSSTKETYICLYRKYFTYHNRKMRIIFVFIYIYIFLYLIERRKNCFLFGHNRTMAFSSLFVFCRICDTFSGQ